MYFFFTYLKFNQFTELTVLCLKQDLISLLQIVIFLGNIKNITTSEKIL